MWIKSKSSITKLLSELDADKLPGPDELPNLLLENAPQEISPFFERCFSSTLSRPGHYPRWELTPRYT